MAQRLPPLHLILALAVVAMWGTNFVVVHAALKQFPPVTLGVLRFLLSAFPLVLLVPRPTVSWRLLAAYGLLMGVQYSLLYVAMRRDISPGLTSVVLQVQVVFSVLLASLVSRERPRPFQVIALAMAAAGLVLIALRAGPAGTLFGVSLVIGAGFCWGVINTFLRQTSGANAFAYVVWGSLFALGRR